jgi:NAD(P)-dependent dehydrogenase (short-subunit alcohol dehydrogenase family)
MVSIDLGDRVAVVTGASSGMGAETARVMARCGATVVATGRDQGRLDAVVDEIATEGGTAVAVAADLAHGDSAQTIVRAAQELAGRIDVLVLAAGQFASTPFATTSQEELDDLWSVHVRAPFLLLQSALPLLSDRSSVLFYSSTVAQVGFAPYAAYSAVKGAVDALARSLAIELAPRTRVNVLAPGFTGTPMVFDQFPGAPGLEDGIVSKTPVGFLGGPESIAYLAAYLASDMGGYVAGTRMVVDGGWTAQGWQP